MSNGYVVTATHDRETEPGAVDRRREEALAQLVKVQRAGRRKFTKDEEIFAASNGVRIVLRRTESTTQPMTFEAHND